MKTKRLTRAEKEAQGLRKPTQSAYERKRSKDYVPGTLGDILTPDQRARLEWEARQDG